MGRHNYTAGNRGTEKSRIQVDRMNAARNASAAITAPIVGSGMAIYAVYIVIAVIVVAILYQFVFKTAALDVELATAMQPGNPTGGLKSFKITQGDATDGKIRIKPGGAYTISFWMNIKAWGGQQPGAPQSVLNIMDGGLTGSSLLSVLLYPNDPQMMVRVNMGSAKNLSPDFTNNATRTQSYTSTIPLVTQGINMPQCDVNEIDLQRWINFTSSVNGRIVDIYYDGKLNRSCILPALPISSVNGQQTVQIGEAGGFTGSFGVINYFAYPLTPDRIYSIYLAGPGGPPTFFSLLQSKLGINLTYTASA